MENCDSTRIWISNNTFFVNGNTILVSEGGHIVLRSFKTVQTQKNNSCQALWYKIVTERTWYRFWLLCPYKIIFWMLAKSNKCFVRTILNLLELLFKHFLLYLWYVTKIQICYTLRGLIPHSLFQVPQFSNLSKTVITLVF